MPVVINEFEVVAEPPPAAAPGAAGPAAASPTMPPWTIHDFEHLVRRQAERAARVRAD